jgi:hypothetical protein
LLHKDPVPTNIPNVMNYGWNNAALMLFSRWHASKYSAEVDNIFLHIASFNIDISLHSKCLANINILIV